MIISIDTDVFSFLFSVLSLLINFFLLSIFAFSFIQYYSIIRSYVSLSSIIIHHTHWANFFVCLISIFLSFVVLFFINSYFAIQFLFFFSFSFTAFGYVECLKNPKKQFLFSKKKSKTERNGKLIKMMNERIVMFFY